MIWDRRAIDSGLKQLFRRCRNRRHDLIAAWPVTRANPAPRTPHLAAPTTSSPMYPILHHSIVPAPETGGTEDLERFVHKGGQERGPSSVNLLDRRAADRDPVAPLCVLAMRIPK